MVVDNAWDDFVFLVSYKYNRVSRIGKKILSLITLVFAEILSFLFFYLLPSKILFLLIPSMIFTVVCSFVVLLCSSVFFKKLLRFCCWPSHRLSSPSNCFLCYGGPLVIPRRYFLFSNMLTS